MKKETTATPVKAKKLGTVKVSAAEATKRLHMAIDSALKGYHRGREGIQKALVAIIVHAFHHGDYTSADRLLAGLNDGNGKSCRMWLEKFGGLTFDLDAGKVSGWTGKAHIEANMEAGRAKPWYTMTPPNTFQPVSLKGDLLKVLERHNKLRAEMAKGTMSAEKRAKIDETVDRATVDMLLSFLNFQVEGDLIDVSPVRSAMGEGTKASDTVAVPAVDVPALANAA